MGAPRTLPLPPFYDPRHAESYDYRPDSLALFEQAAAWRERYGIKPSAGDETRVHLLLIDVQKDFCFPEGTLYVGGRSGRGAIEDNDRLARFIYANLSKLTHVTCTMDTHFPFQIFFPSFWLARDGAPLGPHREIVTVQIRSGEVKPNPAAAAWLGVDETWLARQVEFYAAELEARGKYTLYLWPFHCLLGSDGHALAGVIQEARLFHAFVRGDRSVVEVKGGHPLTENYSVLSPEVRRHWDGTPLAEQNAALVETLLQADRLIVAGQAASHCVKSTLDDLLAEIERRDRALARRVYVLRDGMSAVAVPDPAHAGGFLFDFTPQAEAALRRYAEAGMNVVDSTTPVEDWPGWRG